MAKLMRYIARALTVIWAGFWVFFSVSALVFDPLGGAITTGRWDLALPELLKAVLFFVVPAAIPWLWEAIGGIVLVVAAFVVPMVVVGPEYRYLSPPELIETSLLLGLPPLVAGILFLASWRLSRRAGSPQDSA